MLILHNPLIKIILAILLLCGPWRLKIKSEEFPRIIIVLLEAVSAHFCIVLYFSWF